MPHRREEKWEPEQPLRPNSVRADGDENGIEQSYNENSIYATWLTTRKIATRWPVGGPRSTPRNLDDTSRVYTCFEAARKPHYLIISKPARRRDCRICGRPWTRTKLVCALFRYSRSSVESDEGARVLLSGSINISNIFQHPWAYGRSRGLVDSAS
jgi:hypothetical protein